MHVCMYSCIHRHTNGFFIKSPVLATLPFSWTTIRCGNYLVIANGKSLLALLEVVSSQCLKKYFMKSRQIWYTEDQVRTLWPWTYFKVTYLRSFKMAAYARWYQLKVTKVILVKIVSAEYLTKYLTGIRLGKFWPNDLDPISRTHQVFFLLILPKKFGVASPNSTQEFSWASAKPRLTQVNLTKCTKVILVKIISTQYL